MTVLPFLEHTSPEDVAHCWGGLVSFLLSLAYELYRTQAVDSEAVMLNSVLKK